MLVLSGTDDILNADAHRMVEALTAAGEELGRVGCGVKRNGPGGASSAACGERLDTVGEVTEAREVFAAIYDTDHWGGSGAGSVPDASASYRHVVQRLLASVEVRRVVEVGCGDWQVGSLQDWSGVRYEGLDVVPAVVDENRRRFGSNRIRFLAHDVLSDPGPRGDLLLVKDVLQHWPNAAVGRFLTEVVPRYPFALITNDVSSVHWEGPPNQDVELGAWRTLDLEAEPFGLAARARWDFDVAGAWTKRMLLVARPRRWTRLAQVLPRSVRRIAPSIQV